MIKRTLIAIMAAGALSGCTPAMIGGTVKAVSAIDTASVFLGAPMAARRESARQKSIRNAREVLCTELRHEEVVALPDDQKAGLAGMCDERAP